MPLPPDDRVHCDACVRLMPTGCARARQANVPVARVETEAMPHRCTEFHPLPDDPDQRAARARWPGLFEDDRIAPVKPGRRPGQGLF